MLSVKYRFHGRNSLNTAYRHGAVARGELLMLKYSLNPKRKQYRAAVVVSKKIAKSAVIRNRIRRRIYEVLRLRQQQITQAYDLIFTVTDASIKDVPDKQLKELVDARLQQAKIFHKPRTAPENK